MTVYRVRVPGRRLWEAGDTFQVRTGLVFTRQEAEARHYATPEAAARTWEAWGRSLWSIEAIEVSP